MLSKILAGVFAVAVLGAGGYAYWEYSDRPCHSASDQPSCGPSEITVKMPCCQEPSRSSCVDGGEVPCCNEDATSAAEVLAIAPREVK